MVFNLTASVTSAIASMLSILVLFLGFAFASGRLPTISQEYDEIYRRWSRFSNDVADYEIVHLDLERHDTNSAFQYEIQAFGSNINLRLQPNERLTTPNFIAVIKDGNDSRTVPSSFGHADIPKCHYLHRDDNIAAAVSLCRRNGMEGILFLPNSTLEIHPLSPDSPQQTRSNVAHVIRKASHVSNTFLDDAINLNLSDEMDSNRRKKRSTGKAMTIEAALFLDEPGYKLFAPFFDNDDKKLCEMLLAYVNAVQALYHHPSLGHSIDISLVRMEIFKKQPQDLPHFEGERNQLLDSFCLYNEKHNPKSDSDPEHWDMGLYISGLNFFAVEHGRRSDVTMGLATVNGVCTEKYNCVIAEFGTTNVFGKPYPSAGFTSVYVLAHEMGHNIGMHHDSTGNNCPKEGFIMSPSRGTNGETIWSPCSAEIVNTLTTTTCLDDAPEIVQKNLDHVKYRNNPGQLWRAKTQCEVLIRDHDAELYNPDRLQDICENLQCKTPHRTGFYFAGPALQGTDCGDNRWCQGGQCVPKTEKPDKVIKGGWSDWVTVGECTSGCIKKSKGYQPRRRTCTRPTPINTDEGCKGPAYDVQLCKDEKVCEKKRKTSVQYATYRCREFSKILPDLDPRATGLQASHEQGRLWIACAIFCKRKDTKMYYTPRLELNDLGSDPYFPDGTWCHNDGVTNYYCLQHHCLPENFKYVKGAFANDDVAFPQNAAPRTSNPSQEILQYLGLDLNGKPLLTTLRPEEANPPPEDDWSDKDYLEIPDLKLGMRK